MQSKRPRARVRWYAKFSINIRHRDVYLRTRSSPMQLTPSGQLGEGNRIVQDLRCHAKKPVFDFWAYFCQSAPMETHAFSFRARPARPLRTLYPVRAVAAPMAAVTMHYHPWAS